MSTGTLVKYANVVSVAAVIGIAAVVSYSHIYELAVTHFESGYSAALLPLSVDGLLVASSLGLLNAARGNRKAPRIARLTLLLGVLATIAANVLYGAPHGFVSAVISAWPAIALVLTVEAVRAQVTVSEVRPEPVSEVRTPAKARVPEVQVAVPEARVSKQVKTVSEARVPGGKLPSLRTVMQEAKCGQETGRELMQIMREKGVGLAAAKHLREEGRHASQVGVQEPTR